MCPRTHACRGAGVAQRARGSSACTEAQVSERWRGTTAVAAHQVGREPAGRHGWPDLLDTPPRHGQYAFRYKCCLPWYRILVVMYVVKRVVIFVVCASHYAYHFISHMSFLISSYPTDTRLFLLLPPPHCSHAHRCMCAHARAGRSDSTEAKFAISNQIGTGRAWRLPRGGVRSTHMPAHMPAHMGRQMSIHMSIRSVSTSLGPVQFGMPPETIKDSMAAGVHVCMDARTCACVCVWGWV